MGTVGIQSQPDASAREQYGNPTRQRGMKREQFLHTLVPSPQIATSLILHIDKPTRSDLGKRVG